MKLREKKSVEGEGALIMPQTRMLHFSQVIKKGEITVYNFSILHSIYSSILHSKDDAAHSIDL